MRPRYCWSSLKSRSPKPPKSMLTLSCLLSGVSLSLSRRPAYPHPVERKHEKSETPSRVPVLDLLRIPLTRRSVSSESPVRSAPLWCRHLERHETVAHTVLYSGACIKAHNYPTPLYLVSALRCSGGAIGSLPPG